MLKYKGFSLLPLGVFICIFLLSGMVLGDFYFLPAPIAVLCGVITAFVIFRKNTINQNVQTFVEGCGNYNIILMCIIALFAGAFSSITKEIGAVSTIVQITKTYLSEEFLYVGVFVLASFLSFASGTSVGAITALTPIVGGFVGLENISTSLIAGSLLGGAMFGDNLSFISDTTIAATQSQNCQMKDKFWVNVKIALPSAIITMIILTILGINHSKGHFDWQNEVISWIKIIPYLAVIVLASVGVNVLVTLFVGILLGMGIALGYETMPLTDIIKNIYSGFESMGEIFLVFLFMGGLAHMMQKEGGIDFLVKKIERFMTTPSKGKIGIALLVGMINIAIANNTISIIVTAPIAKQISNRFAILPSHTASILDIASCVVQIILPYGAQMLLLIKILNIEIDYISLASQTYYTWLLLLISVIFFAKNNQK